MSHKQVVLFSLLALASIFSGLTFGLLDIFGFVDGRHTISFSLLGISAMLLYISLITVFILNISHNNRIYSFIALASLLFGVTFFLMNLNPLLSFLATVSYFYLLLYAFQSTTERFALYIKFSPKEIFFPVLKKSLLCVLVILSFLAYGQSKRLVSQNSLITPLLVKTFFKPAVTMINQQINAQLKTYVGETLATL